MCYLILTPWVSHGNHALFITTWATTRLRKSSLQVREVSKCERICPFWYLAVGIPKAP